MTDADINDLETRDYIFKIGNRGKGIQARYDENTDVLIFPRAAFDYVYKLLEETLSQEPYDTIARFPEDRLEYALQTITRKPCKVEQDRPIGHWIRDAFTRTCPFCDTNICETDDTGDFIPDEYCPKCGAKME